MRILKFLARLYIALSLSATLCVADYALYTGPFVRTGHEFLHFISGILEIVAFPAAIVGWISVWVKLTELVADRFKRRLGKNGNLIVPGIAFAIALPLLIYFGVSLNLQYTALLGSSKDSFTDESLISTGIYGGGFEAVLGILIAALVTIGYLVWRNRKKIGEETSS